MVDLVYVKLGGGHIAATNALSSALEKDDKHQFNIRALCLDDMMYDMFEPSFLENEVKSHFGNMNPTKFYNDVVLKSKKNKEVLFTWMKGLVWYTSTKQVQQTCGKALKAYWSKNGTPDVCVNLQPVFTGIIRQNLYAMKQDATMMTCITDFVPVVSKMHNYFSSTWFDCDGEFLVDADTQLWICGTDKAYEMAIKNLNYKPSSVIKVEGMVVHPDFYSKFPQTKSTATCLNILIFFGGTAPDFVFDLVQQILLKDSRNRITVLCGKNEDLQRKLLAGKEQVQAIGYVNNSMIAKYMKEHDLLIGKPGPGVVTEAIVSGLALLLTNNGVMAQERPVLKYVLENKCGLAVDLSDRNHVETTLDVLFRENGKTVHEMKTNSLLLSKNLNAVFQVSSIIREKCTKKPSVHSKI